jgi:hypothetical protein
MIHSNLEVMNRYRTRMLIERINQDQDEQDGATQIAENSLNIRCDTHEELIVNKRFEQLHELEGGRFYNEISHEDILELEQDPDEECLVISKPPTFRKIVPLEASAQRYSPYRQSFSKKTPNKTESQGDYKIRIVKNPIILSPTSSIGLKNANLSPSFFSHTTLNNTVSSVKKLLMRDINSNRGRIFTSHLKRRLECGGSTTAQTFSKEILS